MAHLDDFPALSQWYHKNIDIYPGFDEDPVEHIAWRFCHALKVGRVDAFILWHDTLSLLLNESEDIVIDFQEIERFFDYSGASLTQIISSWGYEAFDIGKEDEFFLLMQKTALKTGLVSFFFLAAWSAFNQNDYESCLDMCDRVKITYAPILTLKGQALLESGNPSAAIPILEDAIAADEQEVLAFFQLAKAFWLEKKYQGAYDSLQNCLKVVGSNPEISLFMTIVVLEAPFVFSWHQKAWEEMLSFLPEYKANEEFVEKLIKLVVRANRIDWMELIAEEVEWKEMRQSLLSNQKLGSILRLLGEKQWFGITKKILDSLIDSEPLKDQF